LFAGLSKRYRSRSDKCSDDDDYFNSILVITQLNNGDFIKLKERACKNVRNGRTLIPCTVNTTIELERSILLEKMTITSSEFLLKSANVESAHTLQRSRTEI
jgi:hypothetical protein